MIRASEVKQRIQEKSKSSVQVEGDAIIAQIESKLKLLIDNKDGEYVNELRFADPSGKFENKELLAYVANVLLQNGYNYLYHPAEGSNPYEPLDYGAVAYLKITW